MAFLFGPVLGFVILFVRKNLPESPRWLIMHGREKEAEEAVAGSRRQQRNQGAPSVRWTNPRPSRSGRPQDIGFLALARTLFATYPKRAILGASLMITQSFLYNAIFFTYALVLTKVYGVDPKTTAYYFMFFALGNLVGPLVLGHLFDPSGAVA